MDVKTKEIIILLVAIFLTELAGILTVIRSMPEGGDFWYLLMIQMLGPLGGWLGSALDGMLIGAIWLLTLSTVLTGIPIYFYVKNRKIQNLLISCILWYFFGYLFAIGIWI